MSLRLLLSGIHGQGCLEKSGHEAGIEVVVRMPFRALWIGVKTPLAGLRIAKTVNARL
jgi:hypothetical protein